MRHKTYSLHSSDARKKKWAYILLILLMVAGGVYLGSRALKKPGVAGIPVSTPKTSTEYISVNGKYLFSGTIMLGRAVETFANGDYNQPFSGMATLGTYDAAIGDLECPVTTNNVSYQTQVDSLIFNCQSQSLPSLKKYFPIINLSSNHNYDQGKDGYDQTVARLNQAGFQVVGNYNPHIEPDDCKPVVLPTHSHKSNGQEEDSFLPIALCSYYYKSLFSPQPGELESIQKWSKIMPVIALMNEGPEYQHIASAQATGIAHEMIDFGASFVVGNGTHWVQNTEVYRGKLIAYSLGNFIFDQLDYDGRIALNLSVSINLQYNENVSKWLKIGDSCQSNAVNCLGLAKSQNLQKINPSFAFDAIGSYGGYKQVATRANTQQQSDIEKLANWATTQQLLLKPSQ